MEKRAAAETVRHILLAGYTILWLIGAPLLFVLLTGGMFFYLLGL